MSISAYGGQNNVPERCPCANLEACNDVTAPFAHVSSQGTREPVCSSRRCSILGRFLRGGGGRRISRKMAALRCYIPKFGSSVPRPVESHALLNRGWWRRRRRTAFTHRRLRCHRPASPALGAAGGRGGQLNLCNSWPTTGAAGRDTTWSEWMGAARLKK